MAANIFAKALKVEKKPTAAAKKAKVEIAIDGIQSLAEIRALMTTLEATAKTLETEIKDAGFKHFLEMDTSTRPESFKGVDGFGSASVEMRKRGTNSALNADEVAILEGLGLKPHKQIVTTEMFGINPVFAADTKLMDKVSKALEKIVPEGFIILQEEVSKLVVSDELCDAAFKLPEDEGRAQALSLVTTMALKPRLSAEYNMNNLSAAVFSYLGTDEVEAEGVAEIAKAVKKVAA